MTDSLAQTVRKVRHVLCNCECRSAQTGFEALRELDELVGQFEEAKQRLAQAERENAARREAAKSDTDFLPEWLDAHPRYAEKWYRLERRHLGLPA